MSKFLSVIFQIVPIGLLSVLILIILGLFLYRFVFIARFVNKNKKPNDRRIKHN